MQALWPQGHPVRVTGLWTPSTGTPLMIKYADLTEGEHDAADRIVRAANATNDIMGGLRLQKRLALVIALTAIEPSLVPSQRARLVRYFKGI